MAKTKTIYECQHCGHQSAKWVGKCVECEMWNSYEEVSVLASKGGNSVQQSRVKALENNKPKKIEEIRLDKVERLKTGIAEFDRVMGGGITLGSLNLIGGEPGIGKSTLLMEVCGKITREKPEWKILYVSGEESESQIAQRSQRLGVRGDNFYILHQTCWEKIAEQINKLSPDFLVVDSIQTTASESIPSAAGTVTQIREVTYELMNCAKSQGITSFIIGHVTKDGNISGPKVLEHMVDGVVYFEGDQYNYYRLLRVLKNRFGNTHEVGIFEMQEDGLREVHNPSQYFIEKSFDGAFGRSLSCVLEGTRPLFVEIQALVVENKFGNGRRTTHGIDQNRLAMLVAVIEKYYELPLFYQDIYVNVVGGLKLTQRDSDLSVIASLLSSYYKKPLNEKTLFLGEVGLTGEIRKIPMANIILKEVDLLQYERVVTSKRMDPKILAELNLEVIGVEKISDLRDYELF